MPAEVHILFSVGKKVCKNPTAASAAMEVFAEAKTVVAAPAEAEKKVNGGSVVWLKKRTQCLASVVVLAFGPQCVYASAPFIPVWLR